ncbi:MAG: ATP-binding cassette domain-containing protein, partial [Pseudomonadota bacterium]
MDGTVQQQSLKPDAQRQAVIRVRGLRNQFGPQVVHDHLDLDVWKGEVLGVVGGSGTGKSVLLRTIVGLNKPAAGSIEVLGVDVLNGPEEDRRRIERHWGVAFQDGALFSSLTVLQNVMAPLREHTGISEKLMKALGALKISLVGLPQLSCGKFPSE